MKRVTASLIGLLVASPLLAQEPAPAGRAIGEGAQETQQQGEHVVKRGDTLWDLAGTYLANPFQWRTIYQANTGVVEDPHWIYPGEVLVIPGLAQSVRPDAGPAPAPVATVERLAPPHRTVFYREPPAALPAQEDATVLSEPMLDGAAVKPGEFFAAEFLADPDALPRHGRMIRPKRELAAVTGLVPTAHPEDEIFISNDAGVAFTSGERLMLLDAGRRIRDAGGQRVMTPTAIVEVLDADREVIRARIAQQYGPVKEHQLLVPLARYPDLLLAEPEPVRGGSDLRGRILEFAHVQPLYGDKDRAFIDLGSRDGVGIGDVFVAYLPERPARSGFRPFGTAGVSANLPPEPVAELRVVRVTDASATVSVDRVMLPELDAGVWVQRVRRMP